MHLFIEEMSQQNPATFEMLLARARGIYRENMDSYIRLVLRKTFSRLMVRVPANWPISPSWLNTD